jgi:cell division protein FtsL
MTNLATSQKTVYNKVVLVALIILAIILSVLIIYKFTHHTTDNYAVPNNQTRIDQQINSSSVK